MGVCVAGGGFVAVSVGTGVCEGGMGVRDGGMLVVVALGVRVTWGVLVKTAVSVGDTSVGGVSVSVAVGGAG